MKIDIPFQFPMCTKLLYKYLGNHNFPIYQSSRTERGSNYYTEQCSIEDSYANRFINKIILR